MADDSIGWLSGVTTPAIEFYHNPTRRADTLFSLALLLFVTYSHSLRPTLVRPTLLHA